MVTGQGVCVEHLAVTHVLHVPLGLSRSDSLRESGSVYMHLPVTSQYGGTHGYCTIVILLV